MRWIDIRSMYGVRKLEFVDYNPAKKTYNYLDDKQKNREKLQ